jgi:hypothetical protein
MSQELRSMTYMISPWDFLQPTLEGVFGRHARMIAKAIFVGFLLISAVWHEPLYWLIQQLANWQLGIFRPLLRQIYHQIPHVKVPTTEPRIR